MTGTIKAIETARHGGIAIVTFENDDRCYLSAGFGMRQLVEVLGNPIGESIEYEVDDLNIMTGFDLA